MRRSSSTERISEPSCSLLAAPLRLLVVVELAFDPVGGAVEEIDRRPEQVLEVGFEARVGQRRDERVEDVGDGVRRRCRLRAVAWGRARPGRGGGRRAGVRRGRGRSEMRCAGARSRCRRVGRHGEVLCRIGRAHRGLRGDHQTAGGPGLHRRAQRQRPKRSGGWRGPAILFREERRACPPTENSRPSAIAGPGRLPSDRPLEGRGAALSDTKGITRSDATAARRAGTSSRRGRRPVHEADHILRRELDAQCCPKLVEHRDGADPR